VIAISRALLLCLPLKGVKEGGVVRGHPHLCNLVHRKWGAIHKNAFSFENVLVMQRGAYHGKPDDSKAGVSSLAGVCTDPCRS
jgi:hypothetical protein